MATPFKALLVEGTSGVGKSTLIDALIRRHVTQAEPRKIRSLVHLAQSHTYGPLAVREDEGSLTVAENQRHLDRIISALEWLRASVQEHDKPWCFVLVDTLHLTHCVRPGIVSWGDVAPFDRRLAALGCKLLFVRGSSTTLWNRGIQPRLNAQFLVKYARKFGRNHEEIHSYFVQEQETMARLFERSSMAKLALDNDGPDETQLETISTFWMSDAYELRPDSAV